LATTVGMTEPTVLVTPSTPNVTYTRTDASQWEIFDYHLIPSLGQPYSSAVDLKGDVWIGSGSEVTHYDGNQWVTYTIPLELLPAEYAHQFNAIAIGLDNSVWLGGPYHNLYRFDGEDWQIELEDIPVSDMEVSPKDGSLWLAPLYYGQDQKYIGVMKYDGEKWTSYTTEDGLASNDVRDNAIDNNGIIWVAAWNGISYFDGNIWQTLQPAIPCSEPPCVSYLDVTNIAASPEGAIWVLVKRDALYRLSANIWQRYENDAIFLDGFPVSNMCLAPDEKIWLGKWSDSTVGFSYFQNGNWYIPYYLADNYIHFPNVINDITCAADNSIWIVTNYGVEHFNP
jgi:hypothetical protein